MKSRCYQLADDDLRGIPWLLIKEEDDWGIHVYDLLRPSGRFWTAKEDAPDAVRLHIEARKAAEVPSPLSLLRELQAGDNWLAMTRRTLGQLRAWFLVTEDPQRRLESRPVCTLAHQASMVAHVVNEQHLRSVLIADEVGLGKTIEAALIVERLLQVDPRLRVLYLAPARLVRNVRDEFERIGLEFKMWVSGQERDASNRLTDSRVVASIHRACHPGHVESFVESGNWDVIIVDECHHLSDWGHGGGKPTRKYQLVRRLRDAMPSDARLILMSGTPHQGHGSRFENLLKLLQAPGEDESAVAGRVVYRTKEDIVDWNGKPLFPKRQVNPPIVLKLDAAHRQWLEGVFELFQPAGKADLSDAKRRAVGWRCGQALQWATSSIQAGLGYLVRQAIRAGWTLDASGMKDALLALRPYRNGADTEPLEHLFARVSREVGRQDEDGDVEDIEEPEEAGPAPWRPNAARLSGLLLEGVALLARDPDSKWRFIKERLLDPAGDEKVVLFAQPIETVSALAAYLEGLDGKRPAVITGGQTQYERDREIREFWREDGPRYLVSSRAGGEGINLQVARRLVHVDVPWNPMELEQRVGRVHRFLSKRTIIVDTIVVEDSREVDAYRIARDKLHEISRTLGATDGARFELLFSRVMALVPPEEFNEVLADGPRGPLNDSEQTRIANLVNEGFRRWNAFHTQFSAKSKAVAALAPGEATWADIADFAVDHLGATATAGVSVLQFEWGDEDQVVESSVGTAALEVGGKVHAFGDFGGMPMTSGDGRAVELMGLNDALVVSKLRELAFPVVAGGAAFVTWPADLPFPLPRTSGAVGVLAFVRQSVRAQGNQWVARQSDELHMWMVSADGRPVPVTGPAKGCLVRGMVQGAVKREPIEHQALFPLMQQAYDAQMAELCRPSNEDRASSTRHAVLPLMAAIIL